jgi:uncharacterized repeat protein (TIGR01451 family)
MRLLRIWILVVMTSLLCGGMVVGAPAEQPIPNGRDAVSASPLGIVYIQPPSPAGGLLQSSLRDPDGSATDQWVWDGFTLSSAHDITEVQWRGGYNLALPGTGGPVANFTVDIYASIPSGTEPDISQPPLVHHEVGGNANETPAEILGGVQTYDYNFVLPAPFHAAAGTKYWVQIEAYQPGAPDWGLSAATGGDGQYFRRIAGGGGYIYQLVSGDAAFTLLALGQEADLALNKVDALDPVTLGDPIQYTLTVSNAGLDTSQNVVLTDNLPVEVSYVSATPDQGTCGEGSGVVTCNLGAMPSGASVDVIIVVTTIAPGTLTNTASVTSDTPDPNPANNSASEDTVVNPAPLPEADLSIAKLDHPDPVNVGAILTYTLTVANAGLDTATAITVTDALPPEVTYGNVAGTGWLCEHIAGTVTCTRPSLAVEVAPNIVITVTAPAYTGTITNTVTVTSQVVDPIPGNNSARITTQVKRFHYIYLPLVSR